MASAIPAMAPATNVTVLLVTSVLNASTGLFTKVLV